MKMKKQFLGILLSLVMVLGLMPGMSMTAQAATAYTSGQIRISDMANGDIIRGTCTIYQNPNRALEIYDTDGTTLLQQYNNGSSRTLSALGYDTIVTKTGVGSGDYNNRLVKLQKLSPSPTVTSVTLDKNELSLDAGGATAELIATVEANYDAIKGVTWSSSDSTVATVNSNGVITPVGAGGPVTIKATSTWDNTKYAECVVTVNASHTHSFTYAADGATITATCTAEGCDLPESSAGAGDHVATLTISANGGTYDGTTAYGATITDANSIQGDAKVQYQKKTDGSYGTATETAPTDAGEYKASITVGGATASVEYTIAQADPTATAPTGLTATYGQTLADVSLEGKNPEGNTPGTWAWADSTQSVGNVVDPATTFKAAFTPDSSNYKTVENVEVSVTVSKAANPATVTGTATVIKGGNTVDLKDNVTKNGATGDVGYAIDGETKGCTLNGSVLTSGDTTGTVTVNVTVATDNNYNALAATPITVTISDKGTQTISAENVTVTYGDTDKKINASVTDPATGGGAISYAVKDESADYIDVNAATGALTIKKVPADGKAYVTVTAAGTAAYEQATKEVTVTINKAAPTVTAPTAKTLTYIGTAQELVNVGSATGGTMYYAVTTENTAPTDDNLYTTSIPAKTDAGTYYVWYKVVGDESHSDTEPTCVTSTIRDEFSRVVTFKVVNGSWNDGTTDNKSVTLTGAEGEGLKLSADQIPAVGSRAADGYKAGSWDNDPDTETVISEDVTYIYSYAKEEETAPEEQEGDVVADAEIGGGAPECSVDSVSDELYEEVASEEEKEAVEQRGDTLHLALKVENIDDTVSESDKELVESAAADAEATIGMFLDVSLYKWLESSPADRTRLSDLHGKKLQFDVEVPNSMKAESGVNRTFYVFHITDGGVELVGKSRGPIVTVSIDHFSVFVLAYSDTEEAEETSDDEMTEEEKRDLEYRKQHPNGQHTYVPKIVKDPTAEEDGLMINVCRYCGFVERDSEQDISGYGVFNAKTVTAIQNEAASGSVQMETRRWISVHRKVLEALQAKTNITLRLRYVYEGKHYVLEINSDDPNLDLLLATVEDEYFGFRYLGTLFTTEEEQ